jgi:hypothetical protein
MNTKSLIFSTITGTITYFLLGWLFYTVLFTELYPATEGQSMLFIFLGTLFYVLLFSIVFTYWTDITTFKTGAVVGLIMGLLYSLSMSFYMSSSDGMLDVERVGTELIIGGISTALMGGVVGLTIGKTK